MLKNLKSLFVVSDEEQVTPQAQPKVEKTETKVENKTATEVDNAILDKLFLALEENNQPGFDYMEFRKSLMAIQSLPIDEATKFQSTFATASTMGVTLEKLLESIEFYNKVLLNEENNFTKALKEQTNLNINDKIVSRDKINLTIKEKSQHIQKLTEEIRAHQAEIETLSASIESAEKVIKDTSEKFQTSMNVIKSQLQQDSEKLKQYIK